ncbi:MAG: glycosyltransferase family 4 protein [Candidatus Jordarchaeum sp.]|uniref:glycosyltransferase family 4 protein n=1 Tax=Candidatus Jordarchaeum sp. TaxID=2823881 RepID=UPI00404A7B5E
MINVAIIQHRIAPFRIPFFERLNEEKNLWLTVFYASNEDRKAKLPFKTRKFHLKSIRIGSSIFFMSFDLIFHFLIKSYDVVVLEGRVTNFAYLLIIPALKAKKIKVCWWSSGFEPFGTGKIKKRIRNLTYSLFCRFVDNIIVYSSKANRYYQSLGKAPSRIFTAINVIDDRMALNINNENGFNIKGHAEIFHNLKHKKVLLFVGKIEVPKKLILLLEAYRLLLNSGWQSRLALLIIGDGSDKIRCKNFARKHSLIDVHFLGEIRDLKKISFYFKISDIFVLPGSGGLAIYHAMIFGLPVVVSSADGTEEDLVINEETGFYFKEDSAEDLAEKLSFILMKEDSYLRMIGKNAKNKALKDFSIEKMVSGFRNAILY